MPTIKYLIENNASYLDVTLRKSKRPKRTKAKNDLRCVADRLSELVDTKGNIVPVTRGAELEEAVAALNDGEIVVVQNTRYEKGESKNDAELG